MAVPQCIAMEGEKSGVKVRLSKEVDDLKDLGACNGHHISNSMKWGRGTLMKTAILRSRTSWWIFMRILGGQKEKEQKM